MDRVLLIGNGGREHAIAESLKRSKKDFELYNFGTAQNPGIKNLAQEIIVGNIMDMDLTFEVIKKINPDLVIVGPDDPIGAGAADQSRKAGVPCFAPFKTCARLESSKSFTRNLLEKYGIEGSPEFLVSENFEDFEKRKAFFDQFKGQIVVKADGLLFGKGVIVAGDHFTTWEEAEAFAQKSIEKFGRVVLEEKLLGEEFSLIFFADGETVLQTPAIQDHKRAFENDEGPNTGGMGCINDENLSLPFLSPKDLEVAKGITEKVMKAIKAETGEDFVGLMYGGFMITSRGIKLIEYNARFGDPEVYNILTLLQNDFLEICEKAVQKKLKDLGPLKFEPKAALSRYLCPEGYPTDSVKNVPITTDLKLPKGKPQAGDLQFFFGSIAEESGQLILKGSRAVAILSKGKSLAEALERNKALISQFHGPLFYRKDIGSEALIQKRMDHMKSLRA